MKIPKIIHQTWKNNDVPDALQVLADTWKAHHPNWEYKLWTDEDNERFVAGHYPEFKAIYDAYPANIQKVDAVRYLILQTYGGIFVDLDFACRRNMEELLQHATCAFGKEPGEHCEIHQKEFIISNAFMATIPHHPFLASLCHELRRTDIDIDHINNNILETTGPFMVSRVYSNSADQEKVTLLDYSCLYPLTKEEIALWLQEKDCSHEIREKLRHAYAIHYYSGTWWDKDAHQHIRKIRENFHIIQ